MLTARFSLNALRSVAIGGLAVLPALVVPAVLVRTLEPSHAAAWLYALSIATYIAHMHMGIGPACSTLTARKTDPGLHAGALLAMSFLVLGVVAIATCALLLGLNATDVFVAPATRAIGEPAWHTVFALASISAALLLPLHAIAGHFQGIFRVDQIIPVNLVRHLLTTILCCAAAFWFQSVVPVAIAYLVASLATLLFAANITRRALNAYWPMDGGLLRRQLGPLIKLAIPAALSGLAQIPLIGLHTVLVAKYVPDAIVAFSITISLLALIAGFVWAVLGNLLPELSERFEDSQAGRRRIGSIVTRGSALLGSGLIGVAAMLVIGLPVLLHLVASGAFASDYLVLVSGYAVVMVIREVNLPKSLAMLAIGRQHVSLIPIFVEAAIGLGLAFVLVPAYGLNGLTLAVLIALFVSSGLHLYLLNSVGCLSGTDLQRSILMTYGALGVIAALWILLVLIGETGDLMTWTTALSLLGAAVFGLCLLALYWFIAVPSSSRTQITGFLSRKA